jgi:hypothetical protein
LRIVHLQPPETSTLTPRRCKVIDNAIIHKAGDS